MNKESKDICLGYEESMIEVNQVMRNRRSFWYEVDDDD